MKSELVRKAVQQGKSVEEARDELTAEAEADRLFLENHRLRARIAELEVTVKKLEGALRAVVSLATFGKE